MRFDYLLYPQAYEILKNNGIEERVKKLKETEEGLPILSGSTMTSDIVDNFDWLKDHGYYKHLPEKLRKEFKRVTNEILAEPKSRHWEVQRPTATTKTPCELEDLNLFTGDYASYVLLAEELWDYEKFGFATPTAMLATIGAYIKEQSGSGSYLRRGYVWETTRADGSTIRTSITGDHNADLRVRQEDITAYPSKDPFGNDVPMRPRDNTIDVKTIAAYHTQEAAMLVAVMKYAEQENIDANYRKDNGAAIVKWAQSLGQERGNAEGFGNNNAFLQYSTYEMPLPRLNEKNETTERTPDRIYTTGEGTYDAHINAQGELTFTYQNMENKKKEPLVILGKKDVDEAIKGLFYQAAKGLGRTSLYELLDTFTYRFSEEYIQDKERFANE